MRCKITEYSFNTPRRSQYHSSQNHYKPVHYKVVEGQYKAAVSARLEAEEFELFIGEKGKEWPPQMTFARRNMLSTSLFDESVESTQNNPQDILPPLWDMYKSLFPAACDMELVRFRRALCASGNDGGEYSKSIDQRDDQLNTGHNVVQNEEEFPMEKEQGPNEYSSVDADKNAPGDHAEARICDITSSPSILHTAGIEHFRMAWEQYDRTVYEEEDGEERMSFDFVLTDPPYALRESNLARTDRSYDEYIDEEGVARFCRFCRRTLKPGRYFRILTSFVLLPKWMEGIRTTGMVVWSYPYLIIKDSSSLVRNKISLVLRKALNLPSSGIYRLQKTILV